MNIHQWLTRCSLSLSFHSYCHRENKYSFALPPPTVGQKGTSAFVHMLNFSREHWYTSHHDYKLLFAHSAKQHLRQCQIIILVLCLRYSQSSEWRHWLLRTNKKLLKLLRWWAKWRLWSNVNNNDWFITDNVTVTVLFPAQSWSSEFYNDVHSISNSCRCYCNVLWDKQSSFIFARYYATQLEQLPLQCN